MLLSREVLGSPTVPIEISVGHTLDDFERLGVALDVVEFAPAAECDRTNFFVSDSIDGGPSNFASLFFDPTFLHFRSKPIHAIKLADVVLLASDGVVLRNGQAVYDTLFDVSPWQQGSIAASYERGKSLRLKNEMRVSHRLPEGTYVVGFNGGWRNYAHWMQQSVPWLVAFLSLRERVPDLRLILPALPLESFQRQTIRLLGIGEGELTAIADDEIVEIPSAYLINRVDLWSVSAYIPVVAKSLLHRVVSTKDCGPKIYIHRQAEARSIANFSEIAPLLEAYGFTIVTFEEMPLEDQIAVMRSARYVIGEHGAGLINVMFCRQNARVLELFNPASVQPAFWSVASVCGLKYGFVVGEHSPTASRPNPDWNSAYVVPCEKLDQAIMALLEIPR